MDAAKRGGNAGAVLNGANEAAVGLFLEGKIRFLDIPRLVERALERVAFVPDPSMTQVLQADQAAREEVLCISSQPF